MKIKSIISIGMLLFSCSVFANENIDTPEQTEEEKYFSWAKELWNSIEQQQGAVELSNGVAQLNVPDNFYYLSPSDSEKVLVEVWGNPPGQNVLGMIFPSDVTPFDQHAWAVTIEYEEDGYVSDEDADDIDYVELLAQMKSDTAQASKDRISQGYEPIELVGWASPPYYDSATNKLHWAKEIKFGDRDLHTLNYNIRVLGRKGVLVLNFIANIDQKSVIEQELASVLTIAEFNDGSKYADFDPDIDDVAAYGLGALVAGKLVAKTGFLAAAIIFLKKFGVIFLVAVGAFVKRLFSRKSEKE